VRGPRLMVLKLGGSVLTDESRLAVAVHEIYRWRREGWQLVVVVSALAGRTADLMERCWRLGGTDDPAEAQAGGDREADDGREGSRAGHRATNGAGATAVASGELESAGLLELLLDRAGVPATVLSPPVAGLIAEGTRTDAVPVALDAGAIHRAIGRTGVVVIPGFTAVDRHGSTVLLGRGGSDLTAVHVAGHLGADRCRLVKDVDGLYERNPRGHDAVGAGLGRTASGDGGPGRRVDSDRPGRYAAATLATALARGGPLLQRRALDLAGRHGLTLELAGFNGASATLVGSRDDVLAEPPAALPPMSVALLGCGTVGQGVYEALIRMPELFRVAGVAVRDPGKHPDLTPGLLVTDAEALAGQGVDVVVDAMGGEEVGARAARAALSAGAHVVTADKALLAARGLALERLAKRVGRRILGSASVGGAVPILEAVKARTGPSMPSLRRFRGVLNGTTSFVLDAVRRGLSFDDAVRQARRLGYAEADPRRDLAGLDAVDKLRVIAHAANGRPPAADAISLEPLCAEAVAPHVHGSAIPRHVAVMEWTRTGWRASVRLQALDPEDPLARAQGPDIAATMEWTDGTCLTLRGTGAGRWPTAEAVIADLLELARDRARESGTLRGDVSFVEP